MAKKQSNDIEMITNMLQEASASKQNLTAITSAVSKYIINQRKAISELERTLESVVGGMQKDVPEFKDAAGNILDKRSKEYKRAKKEWLNSK